jgi:hypothetical protein
MPEISRFFGIIIWMFAELICHIIHRTFMPYQDVVAIYSIDPVECMAGQLPGRQRRLVEAWAELHQVELLADWQQLQQGASPLPIEPLR